MNAVDADLARAPLSARSLLTALGILAALTVLVALACSLVGVLPLSRLTVSEWWWARIQRLIAAAIVGASLATAGGALQGLLRNPLAEPYILGISSGAGVGVLMGMAVASWYKAAPAWASLPVLALVGAILTCGIVYGIAQRRGRLDPYVLLLSGVIVNAFNGAIMLSIYLFLKPYVVSNFVVWMMGNLAQVGQRSDALVRLAAVCAVVGWVVLLLRGGAFNALGLGDDVAQSVGIRVHWLRIETFLVVGMMTAAAVAIAGPIGFVGLIVPHICRAIIGADHRRLVLYSGFVGAMFLMIADTLCRTVGEWVGIGEIPVGVVTAFCGGPFFIVLLRRRFREVPS